MGRVIVTVAALLLAAAILYVGNGLQGTLLAVRANAEGFSLSLIGSLMSAYFVGFIAGCRVNPILVGRVGHIRTFTALASIASASALAHAFLMYPWAWLLLRVVTGFCFAGIAMIIESWINEKATNDTRGRILSVYRIVDLSALTVGQLLLTLADPMGFMLFGIVSILVSIALVPVALTTSVAPQPIEAARIDLPKLFRVSPLAAAGSVLVGLANTAFWAVGPVFVQRIGYSVDLVAVFMSVTIVGGAVAQWPLGLLSDRIDRRKVIIVGAALSGLSGLMLFTQAPVSPAWMLAGAACFGAFAIPLFGLCIAHANDYAEPGSFVEVNSGLLLLYGLGAVAGPMLAAPVMTVLGAAGLFAYTMAVHLLMVGWGFYRLVPRAGRTATEKEPYFALAVPSSLPTGTPQSFELDPRTPDMSDDVPQNQ